MLTTQRKLFVPNAVLIPTKDGKEGRDFDRTDCTLLLVDGEFSYGDVFTEEAWRNGGEPSYIQRRGDFFLPDESEIPTGRVQLLPDACIVKVPDRDYWCDEVQAITKRIFAVYALDRRQHLPLRIVCLLRTLVHRASVRADRRGGPGRRQAGGIERTHLGRRPLRRAGDLRTSEDIDPMFGRGRRCRPGWLPRHDSGGGYRVRGLRSVTWDGVMEEILSPAAIRTSDIGVLTK